LFIKGLLTGVCQDKAFLISQSQSESVWDRVVKVKIKCFLVKDRILRFMKMSIVKRVFVSQPTGSPA
jgi:hypothetical protein